MKNVYEVRGDVTAIFINSKGKIVESIIDTNDLKMVQEFRNTWGLNSGSYVQGMLHENKKTTYVSLHRMILNFPKDMVVDHIDHNKLDNRKSNLRALTSRENVCNASGARVDNTTSGHLGVSWNTRIQKWIVQTRVNGVTKFRKVFDKHELEQAKIAANESRAFYMPTSKEARENTNPGMEKYEEDRNKPWSTNKTSGLKNIYWRKDIKRWVVTFQIKKKPKYFGAFKNIEDAIEKTKEVRKTFLKESS